ncbi:MAG: STAS domain-containing protein [Planctomycetota bacterium]|nr:STAS domain-containing protein [Planctomycetota bacterium]
MAEVSGALIVQAYEGVVLVQVTRERLLDAALISAIGAELLALLERYPKPNLVLDFAPVAYLSSAMLGKLIALHKAVQAAKGRLAIAGLRPALRPVFTVSQLDRVFALYPDAQQAILAFRRHK